MDISAVLNVVKKGKTVLIDVNELTPNPLQPRRVFDRDELNALSVSIKTYGLIQPVAVKRIEPLPHPMPRTKAKYEIIAGERRWRASKMAGLTQIPCTVFDIDRSGSAMMALVENLQRSDLSFFEEALAMQTLLLMTEMSQGELAHALSISQSTLSNKLRLLRLSERERLLAVENSLSERHCRALVRINSEAERSSLFRQVIENRLSAPQTERLIDEYLSKAANEPTKKRQKKKKPLIKGSIGNMKLLYNTLDKTVSLLHNSGYDANWDKQELDEELILTIRVAKRV